MAGPSTAAPTAGACGSYRLKLAINTHIAYRKPLRALIASLAAISFRSFEDVIVLIGGSSEEHPPRLEPIISMAEVPIILQETKVVAIRTAANAVDYHGLAMLSRYKAHKLVAADTFFCECCTSPPACRIPPAFQPLPSFS